ncbi:MAG: protein kinase domain-containing protein [Oceanococcus sp.]
MDTHPAAIWRFAAVTFDQKRMTLSIRGVSKDLPTKSLQVLLVLLQHAGELVSKDELIEACWDGRAMSDSALTTTIGRLRQVLNEDRSGLIETVKGFGYRLAAPVSVDGDEQQAPPRLQLKAGDNPPNRPQWILKRSMAVGGQADVWLAQQQDKAAETKYRVFKFASDHRGVLALKRELAINRLLRDASNEQAGLLWLDDWDFETQPAFVTSPYIVGGDLAHWAQEQGGLKQVPLTVRLELAAQCADALAVAHAAGVFHKDLKPGNVLIDTQGDLLQARLCDFASGTVLDREHLRKYLLTLQQTTQSIASIDEGSGSLMYIAPEVLRGESVTAQADIYALGILIYQLVIGSFREPLSAGWESRIEDELLRQDIADCAHGDLQKRLDNAAVIAQRLRTLAQRRQSLIQQREEQARVSALQEQVRLTRQRRPWLFGVVASLLAGLLVAVVLAIQLRSALTESTRQVAIASAVSDFLQKDFIALASPQESGQPTATVAEVLGLAEHRVGQRFEGQPLMEASVRRAIGDAWFGLSEGKKAEAQHRKALALLEPMADEVPWELAEVMLSLGLTLAIRIDPEALDIFADLIELTKDRPDLKFWRTGLRARMEIARYDIWGGRLERAIAGLHAHMLEAQARLPETDELRTRLELETAWVLEDIGRSDEARIILEPLVEQTIKTHGPHNTKTAELHLVLGQAYQSLQRYNEAEEQLQLALAACTATLGSNNLETLRARIFLADLWGRRGEIERAVDSLKSLREPVIRNQGEVPYVYQVEVILMDLLIDKALWDQAAKEGKVALRNMQQHHQGDLLGLALIQASLAYAEARAGKMNNARANYAEAMQSLPGDMGPTDPTWVRVQTQYKEFQTLGGP